MESGDWQDPAALGPFPFLQSPGVCRGKNEHPTPGHHSTSQVGKLRQHMSDCDSGEIVLEARGDMCDHDEPSGQQKPLQVGPVLAQVLGTFLSIPGSIAALLWALGSSCVLLSHHPHGKLGW